MKTDLTSEDSSGSDEDTYSEKSEDNARLEDDESLEEKPAEPLAFVVMTLVIGGYTLIGPLQHALKKRVGVSDAGATNEMFTQSVALVQWGKTFLTVGQNVLLSCFVTSKRVQIAIGAMFIGTIIPPLFVFTFGSTWLGWVPVSYLSIGFALGVFECTYLSVISPLGPKTKSIAIMGFPAAFAIVNIFGQSLMALFEMPVVFIFWYVALSMPVAFMLFNRIKPSESSAEGKSFKQAGIASALSQWQEWVPGLIPFCLVNIVSHFVMESVLPAIFNTYNAQYVSVWGPTDTSYLMKTRWFLVILSITMAIGDMSSRKIGYMFAFDTYQANAMGLLFALTCCSLGLYLTIKGVACLAWFSVGLAFFGAGFNYAVTSKYIDKFVPKKHNLAGYSLWMFVGYCGAISGAVLVTMVRGWMCKGAVYEYQCSAGGHHGELLLML